MSHVTHADLISAPIQTGDAGLVIKAAGNAEIFNVFGTKSLSSAQTITGIRLMALQYALKNEEIMNDLIDKAIAAGVYEPIEAPKLNS